MSGDRNHYERAFSTLLQEAGVTALAMDEQRRPTLQGRQLKNFDFLVNGTQEVWALDVKGRRGTPWITRTDLFSMLGWKLLLRGKARLGFVFAFAGQTPRLRDLECTGFQAPAQSYHFALLTLEDAQRLARPRSQSWGTFGFEWKAFCRHAKALGALMPSAVLL